MVLQEEATKQLRWWEGFRTRYLGQRDPTHTPLINMLFFSSHPSFAVFPVRWSRSWTRKAVSAASCQSTRSLWSTAACAAAHPSPSWSTRSVVVRTVSSTSARAAAPTRSRRKCGSAVSANKQSEWCLVLHSFGGGHSHSPIPPNHIEGVVSRKFDTEKDSMEVKCTCWAS